MLRQDIEKVLIRHPSVRDLCVMAYPGKARKNQYWAFIVLTKSNPAAIYDFHMHCAKCFAGAAVDVRVIITNALPKEPSGAVSRRELATLCGARTA